MGRLDEIRNKHSRNLQNATSIPAGTEPGIGKGGKVGSWRDRANLKVTSIPDKFNEFLEEDNNGNTNVNLGTGYGGRNDINRVNVNVQEPVTVRRNNQPVDKFAGLQDESNIGVRSAGNGIKRNYQETVTVTGRGNHSNKFEGLLEDTPINVNVGGSQRDNSVEVRQDNYVKQTNNSIPQERAVNLEPRHYENREVTQQNSNNRNIQEINNNIPKEYGNEERNIRVEEHSNNMPSITKESHIITRESKDLTIGIAGAVAKTGRVNGGIGSDQMETEILSPLKVFEDVERKERMSNRTVLRPDQEYTLAYVPTSVCAVIPEIVAVDGGAEFTIDGITYVVSRKPETS